MRKAKTDLTLYDQNVVGPTALTLAGAMRNETHIKEWWERAKLYVEAMRALDRVVMICYDPDEETYYLASVEERPNAR